MRFILFLGVTCAVAQSPRQLVDELIQNNAEIRAARFRYDAALKRPPQERALPDPKISVADFGVGHPLSGLGVSDFAYVGFGVSQDVPYPGKLSLAAEQSSKEAESEGQNYRESILDASARLKIAYFDWYYARKAQEIVERNRDLVARFEQIARSRYEVGKGSQQDVLKAQLELSSLAQQKELFELKEQSAEEQILSLLNRPPTRRLEAPAEIEASRAALDLDALLKAAVENSPRLRASRYMTDSKAIGTTRARRESKPDFGFSFQWQHTSSRFPDYYMAQAEMKIPVWFWRKQRFGIEEAYAKWQEARASTENLQREIAFAVKDQYLAAKTSERLLDLYSKGMIPQAQLVLESTVSGYETGSATFLAVIDAERAVLGYQMQYYEELSRHEQALTRLEPLVSQTLTKD